jgi:hypothetical protein
MRGISMAAVLAGLLAGCAWASQAQDVAETAASTANSSMAASSIKAPLPPRINPPKPETASSEPRVDGQDSAFMIALSGPSPQEVNRKDLEENAGPNAGKLFLRSLPVRADIFVNGKIVGQTPLLLVVAPGKYSIAMRGPRQESGNRTVGLLPKETQTVVITLKQLYPSTVRAF